MPWQPFLSNSCCHSNSLRTFYFFRDKKILNFNTIIYNLQSFRNIGKSLASITRHTCLVHT